MQGREEVGEAGGFPRGRLLAGRGPILADFERHFESPPQGCHSIRKKINYFNPDNVLHSHLITALSVVTQY